ncbi:MAG: hypothetical protein ACJ0PR_00915, partial [Flavobacteriaceae bacterium]
VLSRRSADLDDPAETCELVVVLSGSVRLLLHNKTLRICSAGQLINSVEALDGLPNSVDVVGEEAGLVLMLAASQLEQLRESSGPLFFRLMRHIGGSALAEVNEGNQRAPPSKSSALAKPPFVRRSCGDSSTSAPSGKVKRMTMPDAVTAASTARAAVAASSAAPTGGRMSADAGSGGSSPDASFKKPTRHTLCCGSPLTSVARAAAAAHEQQQQPSSPPNADGGGRESNHSGNELDATSSTEADATPVAPPEPHGDGNPSAVRRVTASAVAELRAAKAQAKAQRRSMEQSVASIDEEHEDIDEHLTPPTLMRSAQSSPSIPGSPSPTRQSMALSRTRASVRQSVSSPLRGSCCSFSSAAAAAAAAAAASAGGDADALESFFAAGSEGGLSKVDAARAFRASIFQARQMEQEAQSIKEERAEAAMRARNTAIMRQKAQDKIEAATQDAKALRDKLSSTQNDFKKRHRDLSLQVKAAIDKQLSVELELKNEREVCAEH